MISFFITENIFFVLYTWGDMIIMDLFTTIYSNTMYTHTHPVCLFSISYLLHMVEGGSVAPALQVEKLGPRCIKKLLSDHN